MFYVSSFYIKELLICYIAYIFYISVCQLLHSYGQNVLVQIDSNDKSIIFKKLYCQLKKRVSEEREKTERKRAEEKEKYKKEI